MMKCNKNRGSIMIWTLLLGISLATVFFFFSQRLNQNTAAQRDTMKYQNTVTLMESYADYLESLPKAELETMRDLGAIAYEGMNGSITNISEAITGMLDQGDVQDFEISLPQITDKAKIEWNLCADSEENRALTITPAVTFAEGNCGTLAYDAMAETTDSSFTLEAPDAPVSFRISPVGDAVLYDNNWQLDLEMIIGARKKVKVSRTFIPSP